MVRIALVSPPQRLCIHSIKVKILQTFQLTSFVDPSFSVEAPVDVRTVCVLESRHPPNSGVLPPAELGAIGQRSGSLPPGHHPLAVLAAGQEYNVRHLTRLPNDTLLRPTTQPGSTSGIRVKSHQLQVELMFRVLDEADDDPFGERQKPRDLMAKCKKLVVCKVIKL